MRSKKNRGGELLIFIQKSIDAREEKADDDVIFVSLFLISLTNRLSFWISFEICRRQYFDMPFKLGGIKTQNNFRTLLPPRLFLKNTFLANQTKK